MFADVDQASVPQTALWVASAWQQWISAAELPVVAQQMLETAVFSDPWATEVWKSRIRKGWVAVAGGLLIAGVIFVSFPGRDDLFGDGPCTAESCDAIGWFGRTALPWLNAEPWHVLLIVVAPAVAVTVLGVIRRSGRRDPRRRRADAEPCRQLGRRL